MCVLCSRFSYQHISASFEVCANISRHCVLYISSMASLFFSVVLLAFVVKNVDGVRSPPPAAAMVETEVTSWGENPCEKYGAIHWSEDECRCPQDRPRLTEECGSGGYSLFGDFPHAKAEPGCRCVTEAEHVERLRLPVAASALRFCEAVAEHGYGASNEAVGRFGQGLKRRNAMNEAMEGALKKTSPEICQHALVGTINKTEAQKAPWAEEASKISQKKGFWKFIGRFFKGNDEKYGRMRAVKESAAPGEKKLWEHALARVCKDECEDLLKMMKNKTEDLAEDVAYNQVPFAQTCAERVVKQVEAEVLGCCARSCGFNGRTCLLWPFFSSEEKVDWEVECCSEMSILKNSSRELMCNSVLSGRLAIAASQYDLNEQAGTDIGKVLIGQNASLVWTKKGAQKFGTRAGAKVSMDFLVKHKKVGEEYLQLGYFKEKPVTKMLDESTSLMEVSSVDGTCDFGKFKEQCKPEWMDAYTARCKEGWMVAGEHEESSNLKEEVEHHLVFGKCYVKDHIDVASPEECKQIATNSLNQEVLFYYFEYNENSKKPIKCFTLSKGSKEPCQGEQDWWKKIPLKLVQDVINQEDITDYKDLVYVKLKAD